MRTLFTATLLLALSASSFAIKIPRLGIHSSGTNTIYTADEREVSLSERDYLISELGKHDPRTTIMITPSPETSTRELFLLIKKLRDHDFVNVIIGYSDTVNGKTLPNFTICVPLAMQSMDVQSELSVDTFIEPLDLEIVPNQESLCTSVGGSSNLTQETTTQHKHEGLGSKH